MKQVIRYKCDYCPQIYAKPETIERHEKECVHNPEGINCFLCVHMVNDMEFDYQSGYERGCALYYEPLRLLKQSGGACMSFAIACDSFKRKE